nr:MAG TPA: hypothetical protein [Caudoviricetes sp.]
MVSRTIPLSAPKSKNSRFLGVSSLKRLFFIIKYSVFCWVLVCFVTKFVT